MKQEGSLHSETKKKFDIADVLFIAGAGNLFGGIYMIYPPAAFIALGVLLMLASIAVIRS